MWGVSLGESQLARAKKVEKVTEALLLVKKNEDATMKKNP
jgi:hypothetical protein